MTDVSKMTLDELQAEFVESGAQYTRLANRRQDIVNEIDRRKTRASAVSRVLALTDTEKDALREVLGPNPRPQIIDGTVLKVKA